MSSFDPKSYRNLCRYLEDGKSATFISTHTLAREAWYHIHGGKGEYGLIEPLLVIARPNRYGYKCDPETRKLIVRIPIKVTSKSSGAAPKALSREKQNKIVRIRNSMFETVLTDRVGLTLGGGKTADEDQGLVILATPGNYTIVEVERSYWIHLNLEDDQNPLGARVEPIGGHRLPNSTGSTVETASSSDRSDRRDRLPVTIAGFSSAAATYGSSDGASSSSSSSHLWHAVSGAANPGPSRTSAAAGRAPRERLDDDFGRRALGYSRAKNKERCDMQ